LTPNLNSNCAGTKLNIFTAIASWAPKKTPSLLVAQSEKFGVGTCLFIGDHCYAGPDIVQNSTNIAEEQSSPIVLDDFPDTLLTPQTKQVQNIDVTTGNIRNY
jgi:hypothetical protein